MRRIGVLMAPAADDPEGRPASRRSSRGCSNWAGPIGRNVRIDYRWGAGDADAHSQICGGIGRARAGRHPGRWQPRPWRRCYRRPAPCRSCSRTSPIRSAPASSIAWRGRAATPPALPTSNTASAAKWLELLKQIAPGVTRVAVLRDPAIAAGTGQLGAIQAVAPSLGVELSPIDVRDAGEIERAVTAFARASNGGLIVTASALATVHRDLIVTLAARHRLPAVYSMPLLRRLPAA